MRRTSHLAVRNPQHSKIPPVNIHHLQTRSPSSFSFLDEESISPFEHMGSSANTLSLPSQILPLPTHIIFGQNPHPAFLSWMRRAFLHSIHEILCRYTILAISNPPHANIHHLQPRSYPAFLSWMRGAFLHSTHGILCQCTTLTISYPTPANTHHLQPRSPSSPSFLDVGSISPFNT